MDRGIYEDIFFCQMNMEFGKLKGENRITDLEWQIYKGLFENMMEEINELPKKAPDLMIYLTGSFETILKRINNRGRGYELDEGLVSYYRTLWEGYDNWIEQHYNASEVLTISIDEYDYVNNEEDAKKVLQLIDNKLQEIRG